MDRDDDAWVRDLRAGGTPRDAAVADLRPLLLRGLRRAFAGRAGADDAFLDDAVQESLLKVLAGLDSFAGRSRFPTWATAVAVRAALTMLRHRHWRDVSLDEVVAGGADPPPDPTPDPGISALRAELLAAMARVMGEGLTEKQRLALTAELKGVPQAEVARQMGTNLNALYKLGHDARRRLKAGLEAAGFGADDLARAWAE